ncbi:MAG TPA: hypothetical protein VLA55_01010 [Ornithinibacter sp.]|nr:hypothetical protein [Ornithinibacter sp.]
MRYVEGQTPTSDGRDRAAAGLLLAGVTAFQVSLAAGAPWGRLAWGGSHVGVLPPDLRAASAGAAVLWGAVTVAVATRRPRSARAQTLLLRGVCGVSVVGAGLNLASPSPAERALWAPVTAAVAVLSWRAARALVSGASADRAG